MSISSQKQPGVFWLSSFSTLFERLGYYVIAFSLTLAVMTLYNIPSKEAYVASALFGSITYLTMPLGGYLQDKILGIKNTLILGLVMETIGFFIIASADHLSILYVSMGFIAVGVGLFKTSPANLIGRSYQKNDPRIDAGFTLFYMFINIGGLIGGFIPTFLVMALGFRGCFFLSFLFGILAIIIILVGQKLIKPEHESEAGRQKTHLGKKIITIIAVIIVGYILGIAAGHTEIYIAILVLSVIGLLAYVGKDMMSATPAERKRTLTAFIFIILGMIFFMLYYQLLMPLETFANQCINRNFDILGWHFTISPIMYPNLDSVFCIIFAPIISTISIKLGKKDLHISRKFPFGITLVGIGFIIIGLGAFLSHGHKVNSLWAVVGIAVFVIGELYTSALGVSVVAKIAPQRLFGIMMGAWFLIGSSIGVMISGHLAGLANVPTGASLFVANQIYANAFFAFGGIAIIIAIIGFLISGFLKRVIIETDTYHE
ncbi:MAG: oligopeptide:H+ symporter [Fusobacteria bacterium]|nr:oligopeptide:H+ symporter [Fusobacteriota bacterium]